MNSFMKTSVQLQASMCERLEVFHSHAEMISFAAFPLQMGGKEGVLKSQSVALSTLQPEGGLWAHCIPRSLKGSQTGVHQMAANGLPGMPRPSSSGQLEPLPEHPDASCTSRPFIASHV